MRVLKRGLKGNDVRYLQYKLGVNADGSFGSATEQALKAKQRALALAVDGSCGPATQKAIGLSDFMVWLFDPREVWFAGVPYTKQPKHLKTLAQWAEEENADYVFNLAFFNMQKGVDQYGQQYGRTIQYVKGKGYDIGYGGTSVQIAPNEQNACAGYKVAVQDGAGKPVLTVGKRARNANGILDDGTYFHIQSVTTCTEKAIRDHMMRYHRVKTMLIQDGGGSAGFYDRKRGVLLAGEREGANGRAVATVVCARKDGR